MTMYDNKPRNLQESSTLKTQTSLVALLQNEESGALSSAKGSSPKASPESAQACRSRALGLSLAAHCSIFA